MGTTAIDASARGQSKSPRKTNKAPPRSDITSDPKTESIKKEAVANAEVAKPLAPPPRPGQQQAQGNNTPDYFSAQTGGGSLSLEPNPFEHSFASGGQPETPGGTKLPSVHALTSPSALLPGTNGGATPFNWGGGSLRTGPLSPAMLSGPATDYFGDTHHIRGGFPTPNESSLRSGLTPGGSGSMFPAPSPNSSALFAQLASGGATPSTLDFHRTALSAAAKREPSNNGNPHQTSTTTQGQETSNAPAVTKAEPKASTGSLDPHDNDAANGLFLLAQGRNGAQSTNQFATGPGATGAPAVQPVQNHNQDQHQQTTMPHANGGPVGVAMRGVSEGSNGTDDSEQPKQNARGKGKKNQTTTNGRRKAEEAPAKGPPSKKMKGSASSITNGDMSPEMSDEDGMDMDDFGGKDKSKMTDEEKRKNFLERNRVAALKCRQRKKQWLANLQTKVEMFSNENDALTAQITQLREEVVNLKTLLLAHKDCPVTQQQGMHGAYMNQVVEPFNSQMNPYGMAAPMPNQQVMAGQGVQRRFS